MSRAGAYVVTRRGGWVGHAVYEGGTDSLSPGIAETRDGAWDRSRARRPDGRSDWDVLAACRHEKEDGYACSLHGGASHWPVRFCRECMIVLGPLCPWWVLEGSDAPRSWLGVWPKDGEPPIDAVARDAIRALPGGGS